MITVRQKFMLSSYNRALEKVGRNALKMTNGAVAIVDE